MLTWIFPRHCLMLWPVTKQRSTNQDIPVSELYLCFADEKRECVCICLLFTFYTFCFLVLSMIEESNAFPFPNTSKRPGNLAWPLCVLKGSNHKTTSKRKMKVMVGASGTGRQKQVAQLKKKWGLKYTAGVEDPAA